MSGTVATTGIDSPEFVRTKRRNQYFLIMAVVCCVLLVTGFSQSFFLKTFSDWPPLPLYVHVHGWIWTAWFGLFLAQTSLIDAGNVHLHRRVGIGGAALAILMVLYGLFILYVRIMEYHDPARDLDLGFTTALVWANLNLLTAFAVFASLGFYFRRRAETHKRLMLLATFSMMGQPLGRLARFEALQFSSSQFWNELVYGLGGLLFLFLTLIAYDLVKRGRPHPASILGPPLTIVATFISATLIPSTRVGQGLVLMFG